MPTVEMNHLKYLQSRQNRWSGLLDYYEESNDLLSKLFNCMMMRNDGHSMGRCSGLEAIGGM